MTVPSRWRQAVEKRRRPAWCDRILWRSSSPEAVELLSYGSAQMTVSDHMPVTATFALQAREFDRRAAMMGSIQSAPPARLQSDPLLLKGQKRIDVACAMF